MDQQQRLAALSRVPILATLARPDLEHVVKACKWQDYDAGEEILSYRDPSTNVFFLAAGKVRVIIYSAEGRAVLFADLKAGATFGEIAAIDRAPRSAGAEAVEPCTVALLTANQFEELLLKHPAIAYATLRHLGTEVRRLTERVLLRHGYRVLEQLPQCQNLPRGPIVGDSDFDCHDRSLPKGSSKYGPLHDRTGRPGRGPGTTEIAGVAC